MLGKADDLRLIVVMRLRKGLKLIRGMSRKFPITVDRRKDLLQGLVGWETKMRERLSKIAHSKVLTNSLRCSECPAAWADERVRAVPVINLAQPRIDQRTCAEREARDDLAEGP